MKLADPKSKSVHLGGTGDRDRDRGPGSSYSMDKPFLILLLSNSPPLTSGLQPSGRGQQPQVGQQPIMIPDFHVLRPRAETLYAGAPTIN